MKISNILLNLSFLFILIPSISLGDTSSSSINGSSLTIVNGFYVAEISVKIDRDSDAFISAGKSEAQIKIIEDLLFNALFNSNILGDIENKTYKNMLCRLAVDKLLNDKLLLKGLSKVEHRIEGSELFLKMRVEKSKIDEIINKSFK